MIIGQRFLSPPPTDHSQLSIASSPGYVERIEYARVTIDAKNKNCHANNWFTMNENAAFANQSEQANNVPTHVNQFDFSVPFSGKKMTAGAAGRCESEYKRDNSSTSQCTTKNETIIVTPTIPSLSSVDSGADSGGSRRANHHEITETELYRKFEEAFDITLRNNPRLLPGAPAVFDSIKSALFEVQKDKARREIEMRRKLDDAKNEKDQLEAQLRKEMGAIAWRRNDLTKELETAKAGKDIHLDALHKQIDAIEAIKRELSSKMTDVAKEKDDLTKHLSYLSKSRKELECVLETETALAEKDRDALQKVLAERKKLQKQKMENNELESKIEQLAQAASKERKALQAEVAELKKFEDHISQLRKQNDEANEELELEKNHLKESADTMHTKKMMLMESLRDLEAQFKEEIDELQGKIQRARMMHEEEMESIVKDRVMSYLRAGTRDETENMLVGRGEAAKDMGSQDSSSFRESHLDIESIVRERVEAELNKKMEAERAEAESKKKMEAERAEAESKKKMEAERFEAELKLKKKMEAEKMEAERAEMKKKMEAERAEITELRKKTEAERFEAEVKMKLEAERAEIAELKKKMKAGRFEAELKKKMDAESFEADLKMKRGAAEKRETDSNLLNEMRRVESRNRLRESIRTPRTPDRECQHHNEDDGIRMELRRLREEIKMSQQPTPVFERVVERVVERDDLLERPRRNVRFVTPGNRTILSAHSHEALAEDRRDDIQRMHGATGLFVSPGGQSTYSREAEDIDIRRNRIFLRKPGNDRICSLQKPEDIHHHHSRPGSGRYNGDCDNYRDDVAEGMHRATPPRRRESNYYSRYI